LEAYGAANILQEVLTVKSDDVLGRQKIFDSIMKSTITAEPGIPEAFRVLQKEMQSLCLDLRLLNEGNEEVILTDVYESDREMEITLRNAEQAAIERDNKDINMADLLKEDKFSSFFTTPADNDGIGELFDELTEGTSDSALLSGNDPFADSLFDDDDEGLDLDGFNTETTEKDGSFADIEKLLQGEFDEE
jgi:hypothetical protein